MGAPFFWNRIRWNIVRSHFPAQGELLDIGAGAGILGHYIQNECENIQYYYAEPIPSLHSHLTNIFGLEKSVALENDLTCFDVLCLLDVIEHIEDDRTFLSDIMSRMRSGAKLIITVPALQSLWSAWDEVHGHYRRYDKNMLRSLFSDQQGKIGELNYFFPELLPVAWWRKRSLASHVPAEEANFPNWPAWKNNLATAVLTPMTWFRSITPCGTSLICTWTKD